MAYNRCAIRLLSHRNFISRSITMSAQRAAQEKALEDMKEKNPYYEKYADKIAKLQQTSPEDFLNRVDKVASTAKGDKKEARTYSELLNPKQQRAGKNESEIPHKKLADIMKLELIEEKPVKEISEIWFQYHKTKDVLSATLTTTQFKTLLKYAKQFPVFLLPLPRSEGFEFIMLQFANNTVHFTPLLAYQVHGENAPECLTLVYYTEMEHKDIILMRGEYDIKVLNGQEAQCLANELQMFYYNPDKSKLKLLETFTARPDEFKHLDLIKEVENISLT